MERERRKDRQSSLRVGQVRTDSARWRVVSFTGSIRAFSLVEILVVLVIIAALTAIAFPVLARVREHGRRSACMANLKQIGIALNLYRQDYDGAEPMKGARLSHSALGLPYGFSLNEFYTKYVKNRDVLFCPSTTKSRKEWGTSYDTAFWSSERNRPSYDWEGLAALRGPDYVTAVCSDHNGPEIPRSMRRSTEVLIFHVLRIDGRVDVRKFPAGAIPDIREKW